MARHRSRLRLFLAITILSLLTYHLLPPDNAVYLVLRWNRLQLSSSLYRATHGTPTTLMTVPPNPKFKVLEEDIGTIINSGYNPREKLKATLNAMSGRKSVDDVVVVADYDSVGNVDFKGGKVKVYDVLKRLLEDGGDKGTGRLKLYLQWRKALEEGDEVGMKAVKGKELDIIKHVPGLELGYDKMPNKKWYLIVDDDTYIHTPSLLHLLSTLDHRKAHYLGNAVGAYTSRFGHGGSAILFSSAAMHKILVQNPQLVALARKESLTADFGDEVIAKMAQRAGIFLNEDLSHHFNGEPPRSTFVSADRICTLLVGFHKQSPEQIMEDTKVLGAVKEPIRWGDVGRLFGGPIVLDKDDGKVRFDFDFVGEREGGGGGVSEVKGVKSAAHCALMCRGKTCLAWVFERPGGRCRLAPWFMVGSKKARKASGINKGRVRDLMVGCRK